MKNKRNEEDMVNFDGKELISIEELSDKELNKLDNEFFREHPEYEIVKENNSKNIQNVNYFKVSLWVKLFMWLGIIFAIGGLALLFISEGKNPFFKVLIILAGICLIALVIANIIDSKKTDRGIKKMEEWVESPLFKEYSKALDEWYKSKGYYVPNEEDD